MIDHSLKCIFIHIPVTGGSAIEKSLTGKDWQQVDPKTKHMDQELCKIYYADYWDDYFKFSITRNPFDWFVSMYVKQRPEELKDISFYDYINIYSRFQYMSWEYPLNRIQLPFYNSISEVNYVGKFESLEGSFKQICKKLGVKKSLIKQRLHSNQSRREKDYKEYYNDKTKALVTELFRKDLEEFEYEF